MLNSIVNPPFLLLYAFIFPLCRRILSLTIDKPKPEFFLELSVVNNGLKILSIIFSSTPQPLSLIKKSILFLLFFISIIIFPFSERNFTLLD